MHSKPSQSVSAEGLTIGIVKSAYHTDITSALARGAREAFIDAGGQGDRLLEVTSPGTFELPVIAAALAKQERIDAVVTLGCVITGETTHDRFIAHATANALCELSTQTGKPIAFGVLTCQTIEQASARAGGNRGNKGQEAMLAAITACRAIEDTYQPMLRK